MRQEGWETGWLGDRMVGSGREKEMIGISEHECEVCGWYPTVL